MKTSKQYDFNHGRETLQSNDHLTKLGNAITSDPYELKKAENEELNLARELVDKQDNFFKRLTLSRHQKDIIEVHQNQVKESLKLALESKTRNQELIRKVAFNVTKEFLNSTQLIVRSAMKGNVNNIYMQQFFVLTQNLEDLNYKFLDLMEIKLSDRDGSSNGVPRDVELHDIIMEQFQTIKSKWMNKYEDVLEDYSELFNEIGNS
jgi:hypothetical protein